MKTSFYDLELLTANGGTGAVAVALAVNRPQIEVWATDTNPQAVELARSNMKLHGGAHRVHVLQGDVLDPLSAPVELVVANLPYLPESEHDSRYDDEPDNAVYAPGDGLGPYRWLLAVCQDGKLVSPGGYVLLQYDAKPFGADCWRLEDLRAELEDAA